MSQRINVAVIGTGYLGKFHAEKYANATDANLVAICDINPDSAKQYAKQYQTRAVTDYRELTDLVDAVSIATPTLTHCEIACHFLTHNKHVLVEKPIATSILEADKMTQLAEKNKLILQVGHLERFNNAVKEVRPILTNPRFIESIRLAPFKLRGSDVDVVLDLMIHDIDIIQSMVQADIEKISANGALVLSSDIDIANARLEFTNGCVANVTASRVSLKTERKLRIFQPENYIGVDLANKHIAIHRKGKGELFPGIPEIISEEHNFASGDALNEQILAFLQAIKTNTQPVVDGEAGKSALATAIQITKIVKQSRHFSHV